MKKKLLQRGKATTGEKKPVVAGIQLFSGSDSVRSLVLSGPVVHECGLHGIPLTGALSVLKQSVAQLVLPLFGRHHGEVQGDLSLAGLLILLSGLDQRVVGLDVGERT